MLLVFAIAGCGRIGFDVAGVKGDDAGGDGVGDDGPSAVTCETLASLCGPTGTSSCCESPTVAGGSFYRSYDGVGYNDTSYPATVSTFRLDKYEITVGRFRQFVNAGMGTQQTAPAVGLGSRTLNGLTNQGGWEASFSGSLAADTSALVAAIKCDAMYQTWTDTPGGNENRPMNCIDWYEAMAVCIWDGGFLPTEAEWNYAAAGGNLARAYPWSSPPSSLTIDDTSYASYYVDVTKQCYGDVINGCAMTDLVPVGTKPAGDGMWGQSDLGGNVWEWTLDWYVPAYPTGACTDCANLTTASERGVRGGGFNGLASDLRSAIRWYFTPISRNGYVGARCARRP